MQSLQGQRVCAALGVLVCLRRQQCAKVCDLPSWLRRLSNLVTARASTNVGGAAPDTELTPHALAEMSEERFAEILNELQARGDKTKLMQLFGH